MPKELITHILCSKECKYSNYVKLKTTDNIVSGFSDFIPFVGDLIENNFEEDKKRKELTSKKMLIYLPDQEKEQKIRLLKLLKGSKELLDTFNEYQFGEHLWVSIYKRYTEYGDDSIIPDHFIIIIKHIMGYMNNLFKMLQDDLKARGCNLNINQCEQLFLHPKFGFDINKWKKEDLCYLFEIEGIGISSVLKITSFMDLTIIEKTELMIIYYLDYNNDGNTYIMYDYDKWLSDMMFEQVEIDDLTSDVFDKAVNNLLEKEMIIKYNDIMWGKNTFEKEMYNSKMLINKLKEPLLLNSLITTKDSIKCFLDIDELLNKQQKKGIMSMFENNVSIIYGKAGTGKTTLLKGLINIINLINEDIKLIFLTPTAKAKMRIRDIIGTSHNIFTMHSFFYGKKFMDINEPNKTIMIFDESSMIDNNILYNVIQSLENINCVKFVFMGDTNQLPSIGPSDILNKIKQSKCFSNIKLKKIHRNTGFLTKALNNICNGVIPETDSNTFNWIDSDDIEKIITDCLTRNKEISIITTTNSLINKYTDKVRDIVNPKTADKKEYIKKSFENETILREFDRVVHCKNFNNLQLYNGMTGNIVNIDNEGIKKIKVLFDGQIKPYTYNDNSIELNYLKPSYILTVHKSQGQEYDEVLVILTKNGMNMLNKNLLYTALSRAKVKATLVASKKLVKFVLSRNYQRNCMMDLMCKYWLDNIDKNNWFKFLDDNIVIE